MDNDKKGLLFVISGPSGVGKGTICKKLLERRKELKLSVSVTTRAPRPGEIEGVNYFFRSEEQFQDMIARDEFLEYMCVFGKNHYGTPKAYVAEQRAQGNDVILEIDVNGALNVKKRCPDAVMIFIAPPQHGDAEKASRRPRNGNGRGGRAPLCRGREGAGRSGRVRLYSS